MIYPPKSVAEAIVRMAEKPKREVYVGAMAKVLSLAQRLSPAAMDAYMLQGGRMFREQLTTTPDRGQSNLFASPEDSRIEVDFTAESRRGSVYTRLFGTRPGVGFALAAAAAVMLLHEFAPSSVTCGRRKRTSAFVHSSLARVLQIAAFTGDD